MSKKPIDLDQYFPFFLGTIANRWATTSSRLYLAEFGIGDVLPYAFNGTRQ